MARAIGGIFLLHFPSARAAQALPGTVPCGARTFLGIVSDDATVWPAPPSTILRLSPPSIGESRDQVQLFETWSIDSGWGCRCRGNSIRCGRGPPLQGQKLRFGRGPPLQGDFVRRVVPRPAPTRGRGTSMYRSDEIPLQRRPSPGGMSWFRWATATAKAPHSAGAPARRSLGPQRGERRGGAGIGRKQAMDGLRSPVGARDGATRRCARSPHHRGSPRSQWTPALFKLGRSGIPRLGEEKKQGRRSPDRRPPASPSRA